MTIHNGLICLAVQTDAQHSGTLIQTVSGLNPVERRLIQKRISEDNNAVIMCSLFGFFNTGPAGGTKRKLSYFCAC